MASKSKKPSNVSFVNQTKFAPLQAMVAPQKHKLAKRLLATAAAIPLSFVQTSVAHATPQTFDDISNTTSGLETGYDNALNPLIDNIVSGSTYDQVISGEGSVTVAFGGEGSGQAWKLSAVNTYTGPTTINDSATLKAGINNTIADSISVTVNGFFEMEGTQQKLSDITAASNGSTGGFISINGTDNTGSAGTLTANIVNGSTWNGVIQDGITVGEGVGGNVVFTNDGDTGNVLTIGAAQTYTSTTEIGQNAIIKATTDNIFTTSSNVKVDGDFNLNNSPQTVTDLNGAGNVVLSSNMSSGSGSLTVKLVNNSTWAGTISNGGEGAAAGNVTITSGGEGTPVWTVTAQQQYTGTTDIDTNATVRATVTDIFSHSSAVTVDGTFEVNNTSQTVNDLGGEGLVKLGNNTCGGGTLTVNTLTNTAWDGVISNGGEGVDGGNVIVTNGGEGSHVWTVSSQQTYTGYTDIETNATVLATTNDIIKSSTYVTVDGTFNFGDTDQQLNNLNGSGTINLTGSTTGHTLTVSLTGDNTWSGNVTNGGEGAGNVVVTNGGEGAANWIVTAQQGYTGTTTINANSTITAGATDIISNSSAVAVNGTFDTQGHDQTVNNLSGTGQVHLSGASTAGSTLTVNTTADTTWGGVISNGGEGVGNVVVSNGGEGSHTWTVSAAQTYTGTTTINAGAAVQAGAQSIFADSSAVAVNGTFDAHGYDQTVHNLSGTGQIHLSGACTGGSTLTVNTTADTTWGGVISNGGEGVGNLVVSNGGEGAHTWTVNAAQTYTGTTTINAGAAVQASGAQNIFADSSAVAVNGVFDAHGQDQSFNDLSGAGQVYLTNGTGSTTLIVHTTADTTWGGVIANGGEGKGNLVVTGGGEGAPVWTVAAQQAYTGSTDIQTGAVVKTTVADAFLSSSGVHISGVLDANGYAQTLNNLSGEGEVHLTNGTASKTLTVNTTTDTLWNGVISNGGEGKGNLVVTNGGEGSPVWTVAAQQTYTGTTDIRTNATVQAGTGDIFAASSTVTVDGTLEASDHDQTLHNLGGEGQIHLSFSTTGSTLTVALTDTATWNGVISNGGEGKGNVSVTNGGEGSQTWVVGTQQTYTGYTEIDTNTIVQANVADIVAASDQVSIYGGTFNANGHDQTVHNLTGDNDGSIYLTNGTEGTTLTVVSTSDSTWNGVISDHGDGKGNLVVTNGGEGTPTWKVGAQQEYTGSTDIQLGAAVQARTTDIFSSSSAVTVNGLFDAYGNDQTLHDLGGEGDIHLVHGSSGAKLTVALTTGSTWNGVISNGAEGSGAGSVEVSNGGEGSHTWNVGAQQTYTGSTTIDNNVIVQANTNDIIADSTAVTIHGGALFDANGYSQTLGDLGGEGNVHLSNSSSAGTTLTVKLYEGATWNGVISNGGEGAGNLVVTNGGEGTPVWTVGQQQTYTGTTHIASGATVQAGTADIFHDSSQVSVSGLFDTHGHNQILNDLSGEGAIHLSNASTGGSTLTVHIADGSTWNGVISNGGEGVGNVIVTTNGEGETWVVGAAQTYTGTTEIETLANVRATTNNIMADSSAVSVDGLFDAYGHAQLLQDLSGEGAIHLTHGTGSNTLTVETINGSSWNGVISNGGTGKGNLIVSNGGEGSHVWTVNTQQAYTGTTTIQDGASVKAGVDNVFSNSDRVTVNGVFDAYGHAQTFNDLGGEGGEIHLSHGSSATTLTVNTITGNSWGGVISDGGAGKGNLVVTNGGEGTPVWTVSAHQTYTGTTDIHSGATVTAAAADIISASSAVNIDGTFNAGNHNQLFNDLTGEGDINMGSGTLTLNGIHSTTFDGVISGSNTIDFTGDFVTKLTGINTNTGDATVHTGTTLTVDGTISNDSLTVMDGSTLNGHGTITGDVVNNGIVAPGNSPGTLTIGGNYTGTGALQEQITGSNNIANFDRLLIGGTADLSAQTVDYAPLAAAPAARYTRGTSYTYLTATGGLGGTTFSNAANGSIITGTDAAGADIASSPNPALAIKTTYTTNDAIATIVRTQFFANTGQTPNQSATGAALDPLQLTVASGSDIDTIITELDSLTPAGTQSGLDSLSGSLNAELQTASFDLQHRFDGLVGKRLGGDCNAMGNLKIGASGASAWSCAYGSYGQLDGDGNASKVSNNLFGFAAGYEFKPGTDNLVRLGVGYGQEYLKQKEFSNHATQNSYQLGAYGQHYIGSKGLYVGGGLSGAYNTADTTRHISVGGINRTASGDSDGYNVAASALVGIEKNYGKVHIEPVASLEYIYAYQNSFTETGAGAANLSVKGQGQGTLRSSIGAQASGRYLFGNGMSLVPEGRAAFIYDSLDVDPTIDQSIAGSSFTVKGANPGRAGIQAGLGLTLNVNEDLSVFADYTGTAKQNATDNSMMGGVKYKW